METGRRQFGLLARWLVWLVLLGAASLAQATGTLVLANGGPPATAQVLPAGLAALSNGNKVIGYQVQSKGDYTTYAPGPGFTGVLKVVDSSNNLKTTININESVSTNHITDLSLAALVNGGFVAAWTEYDDAAGSTASNFYAIYDNDGGVIRSPGTLGFSNPNGGVQVVGLTAGGFAAVTMSPQQKAQILTFNYAGGSYTANAETTAGDNSSAAPNPSSNSDIGRLYFNSPPSLAALSDGTFVFGTATYDWVNSNYTPLGDFVFKFNANGTAANFASGVNYLRVNWSQGQGGDITVVRGFSGGFASLNGNASYGNSAELTVFNNDGSLVTTTAQTIAVYNGGNKTYYAERFMTLPSNFGTAYGNVNPTLGGTGSFLATLGVNGGNLVAFVLNSSGGFSTTTLSQTTGAVTVAAADSGITLPTLAGVGSPALAVPTYLADGAGYSLLYAVAGNDGNYLRSDLYQVGLTATPPSTDASLSNLTLSQGALSPTFAGGTTTYTASVGNATTSITVTPTANEAHATIKVNGTTVSSGAASGGVSLSVGSNTITVLVTAQDGTTTGTYTVTVTRAAPSTNALLSQLTLSSGTLTPSFAGGTTSYTASVSNSTSSITVTPTVADSAATVKVNGTTVTSGTASGGINLAVGSNTVTVLVTAQDGMTTATYSITVTRAQSSVATLSSLLLSSGTLSPSFASGTTSYTASVTNATASITVTPTVTDSSATVKVNGTTVTSGVASGSISLNVGANTVTVLVTAQDGTTTQSYTVTVTRAPSNVATLSGLTISDGTLSPSFASGTTSYTASVANAVTTLIVTPTVTNSGATVKVNGTTVTSGSASGGINLNAGTNTITVLVTAQDGTTTQSYTLTVTRAFSSVATLANLVLSSGTLNPAFASGTTTYTASVPYSATTVTATPTTADSTATVTVNTVAVTSGSASGNIALVVGSNTITIVVTAQDGTTTQSYTVTVTRADLQGQCGTAQGQSTPFKPSGGVLCALGTATSVSQSGSNWVWACNGGAGNASCSAPLQNTGTSTGQGSASVTSANSWVIDTNNSAGFIRLSGDPKSPSTAPPAGYTFPQGLFDVQLITGTAGTSASVTITYPSAIPANAEYWKWGKSPDGFNCSGAACSINHWYKLPQANYVISGNTITLTLTDGQVGDSDVTANSVIVDPGGPGIPPSSDALGVPTLSEWAIMALTALMGVLGFAQIRRRSHATGTAR